MDIPSCTHHSNTSHVIVYHSTQKATTGEHSHSNTSHVIVYLYSYMVSLPSALFKYISCYCLSGQAPRTSIFCLQFKYISCYCLSIMYSDFRKEVRIFKYISCYCLSRKELEGKGSLLYSNTSHVIVYPRSAVLNGCMWYNSNTSQVV